eukprot:CAMPEP_0119044514 /NCGR_PEP_ID=MMETSP1177-20130426/31966_1 /TAXON_ID=2985 /ORGANISM="Ochromonas sp, Strain CCMP1899" /LENGTH=110 /DNA_ID=CAMNT_0007014695 /DNA_START=40 /DNA_END=368 /DNA_ORIENTATION=-
MKIPVTPLNNQICESSGVKDTPQSELPVLNVNVDECSDPLTSENRLQSLALSMGNIQAAEQEANRGNGQPGPQGGLEECFAKRVDKSEAIQDIIKGSKDNDEIIETDSLA